MSTELEATAQILEAISHQLVLVTSKFCLLSLVYETLIREGKLDPLDFVAALQVSDSPEFRARFQNETASILDPQISSKLVH
jgi:hypothetical protein